MSRVRDHWSIGEVLSLLQDEFPEVTISKIRFLESQGLIDPERTSSGYRKFSDGDYDRLYWILEQQRDHYLPLRVIRDRLDEGQDIGPAPRRNDSRIGESLPDEDYDDQPMDDVDDARSDDELVKKNSAQEHAPEITQADRTATEDDSGTVGDSDTDDDSATADGADDATIDPESAVELATDERSSANEGSNEEGGKAEIADPADQRDSMFRDALAETEGPIVPAGSSEAHPIRMSGENSFSDALTEAARLRAAMSRPGVNGPSKAEEAAAVSPRMGDEATPWARRGDSKGETETLVLSDDVFEAVVVSVPATHGGAGPKSASGLRTAEAPARSSFASRSSKQEKAAASPATKGNERPPTRPAAAATSPTPTISTPSAATTSEEDMTEDGDRSPAPRLLGTRTEGPKPTTKSTAEVLAPPPRPTLPGSSVALDRDELAEQSGCTPGMIDELEKHGMISPRDVAGTILFDSTALTLARLAVQFGRYGLEPRHLRTFRLSAEREVALLTQSIGPTLKANNAETRRRSFDTLQDLAELAASLRSIIVRDLVADLEPGG